MLDKFINNVTSLSDEELFVKRSLVGLLLTIGVGGSIMSFLQYIGYSKDPFPSWILCTTSYILLIVNYKLNAHKVIVNVFNALIGTILVITCLETGGLYSYNLKWFIVILLMSLLFLPRYQFFIWGAIVGSVIVTLYLTKQGDYEALVNIDANTYFVENILFYIITGLFVYMTLLAKDLMKKDICTKNDNLKKYSENLQKQSEELEYLTQQLSKSNERLVDFAHTTSHDLKQPLNTMSSFAQLINRDLENGQVDAKTKEMLNFIQESSIKIKQLINSALDSSKISSLRTDVNQMVDLNVVLYEVIGRLDFQIKETKAEILFNQLPMINANYNQISRVLQNLLSNSMKYARSGVKPIIKITSKELNTEFLCSIKDNGIGIKPDLLNKIFDPFFRSNKSENIGQGIGLSNCKSIIDSFNGKIWAESIIGEYTEIHFSIPKQIENTTHFKKNPRPILSDSSIQNSLEPIK